MGLGTGILLSLGFALLAAIVGMLISGTAKDITLACSPVENKESSHH
ncbi:hypothetical protein DCCM_3139 [Desulfocucumis palustris]|uniref:Uncharacterized protein n=1 Tax=Desulfocucumis palustris TaxID=1898651 RepID=A0A2L2XCQ7_9FIRM|nr:hypothetical protein [Desulfocucumis palustris]GBF34028.1 hypothetical protein DCCM_3139 [Desulfocucumis palustris]